MRNTWVSSSILYSMEIVFRLICRSIIFSTCSKNWSFFKRTNRKKPDKVDLVKKVNSRRAGIASKLYQGKKRE